ncbi:hypothetical protein, partial [Pseudomonas aeruginosa]
YCRSHTSSTILCRSIHLFYIFSFVSRFLFFFQPEHGIRDTQGWCATSCSTSSMISAARAAQGFSQHEQGGDGWLVDAPFGQKAPILAEFVAQASIAPGWFPGQDMGNFPRMRGISRNGYWH